MSQPTPKRHHRKIKPEDLYKIGPHVNVDISLPEEAIVQRGLTQARPLVSVTALIDTGATLSAISKLVIDKLNLTPVGKTAILGVHGPEETDTFYISYTFTKSGFPPSRLLVVKAKDLEKTNFHMLVGRDILRNALLLYDGVTGEFGLEIPSVWHPMSHKEETPSIPDDMKNVHVMSDDKASKRKKKNKLAKASRKKNR